MTILLNIVYINTFEKSIVFSSHDDENKNFVGLTVFSVIW